MTELDKGIGLLLADLDCILELISCFPEDQDNRSSLLTRVLLSDIPFRIAGAKHTLEYYLREHKLRASSGT